MAPLLILVNGLPASGKSTLSKALSEGLKIPYFSKDELKAVIMEIMNADALGMEEIAGKTAAHVFRQIIQRLISKDVSVIIDQIFSPEIMHPFLTELQNAHPVKMIQVVCVCDEKVALERYASRSNSPERKVFNEQPIRLESVQQKYAQGLVPMTLPEMTTLEFETTNLDRIREKTATLISKIESDFKN